MFETAPESALEKRASAFLNPKSGKFLVNGSALPLVDFDVGESYAGTLPISDHPDESRKLYFWFFPSSNEAAQNEITIWLQGGPGAASTGGLLLENGPFLWQPGTAKPTRNTFSWNILTNMVWIDQPVGTGFSVGTPNITDEYQLTDQCKYTDEQQGNSNHVVTTKSLTLIDSTLLPIRLLVLDIC